MKKTTLIFLILLGRGVAFANDSARTFSLNGFLQVVRQFHPVAQQAGIQVDKAAAGVLLAKGEFDPLLGSGGNNKTFDGVTYYQNNSTSISIPAWYGIELQAGIEYIAGGRVNPQETAGKTSFAGISIPLAKNLLMDKRRAALQQAKIMVGASEQEKRIALNNLLMDAADAYWQWVQTYWVYQVYNNVTALNKKRIQLVMSAYQLGDRPAIDTLEAAVQLQSFEYQQNDALLAWQNAALLLNTYLWKPGNVAYELNSSIVPVEQTDKLFDAVNLPDLDKLITDTRNTHPELELYNYKLKMLDVDKRLKLQDLLPKADIKYNQLGKGYDIASTATKNLFNNNYRWGMQFSMPLRLSQGRGAYKMARLKIAETKLQQSQKEIDVINKVKNYYNQLLNYYQQVNLLKKTYANYVQLQRGEETRFFNGESSLFLINSRENKTLETLIKLTEATIKLNKTVQGLQWAAGQLWQQG